MLTRPKFDFKTMVLQNLFDKEPNISHWWFSIIKVGFHVYLSEAKYRLGAFPSSPGPKILRFKIVLRFAQIYHYCSLTQTFVQTGRLQSIRHGRVLEGSLKHQRYSLIRLGLMSEKAWVENTFRGVSTLSCFVASAWLKYMLKNYHSNFGEHYCSSFNVYAGGGDENDGNDEYIKKENDGWIQVLKRRHTL